MKVAAEMANSHGLASIRLGQMGASQAWSVLVPVVETADGAVASQICDALRSWVWKALDRRRRDGELRQWIDILNRVEAFFVERFANLAAKIELMADLLHESLAVAEFSAPEDLLRRRHVASILQALADRRGEWVERGELMGELGLKPANTTRLMTLLLDVGWVEQVVNGREALYRASTEGMVQARSLEPTLLAETMDPHISTNRWSPADGDGDLISCQIPAPSVVFWQAKSSIRKLKMDIWGRPVSPDISRADLIFGADALERPWDAASDFPQSRLAIVEARA